MPNSKKTTAERTKIERLQKELFELKEKVASLKESNDYLRGELKVREEERKDTRKHNEKYRIIYENISEYVLFHDLQGKILKTNLAVKQSFGYLKGIINANLREFLPDPYRLKFDDYLKRLEENGFDRGRLVTFFKDGTRRILEYRSSFFYDMDGTVIVRGLARDISERITAEKNLKAMHQRLSDIIEFLPDAMLVIDRNKEIIAWNRALQEMTGKPETEMVGKGNFEYAIPFYGFRRPILCDLLDTNDPQIESEYDFVERKGDTVYAEVFVPSLYKSKGAYVWVKASPLYDRRGNQVGAIQTIRDISQQKKAEADARINQKQLFQAAKMASLGTLVAGVAHEINNPITSIMLNVQVLQKISDLIMPIAEEQYEKKGDYFIGNMRYSQLKERVPLIIANIMDGSQRVKDIVNDLKDFAREAPLEMNDMVDLNNVLKRAIGLVSNLIKKSTNHFNVEYSKFTHSFKGSARRIEQIVINLLVNACQALPDPSRALSAKTGYIKKEKAVFIEIADQGLGMPPEILQRIKDPFFTTKRDNGGTGLGLAISDRIIRDHDGVLDFNSQQGKGTTARITFFLQNNKKKQA